MNIETTCCVANGRVWTQFVLGSLFSLLLGSNLLAADSGTIKIEEAQRAFQERFQMVFGKTVPWPDNAPDYPPDGFYEDALSNAEQAAALVADLAEKFSYIDEDEYRLLTQFTSAKGGDITGAYPNITPLLSDKIAIPLPDDINSDNYRTQFKRLALALCAAKYVIVPASVGGPAGSETYVESTSGLSFDTELEGWQCACGGDYPCSGTFSLDFGEDASGGAWQIWVVSQGQYIHVDTGGAYIDGSALKVPWTQDPWVIPPGTEAKCWGNEAKLHWQIYWSLGDHKSRVQGFWGNNWQETPWFHIGVSSGVGTCNSGSQYASLNSTRGRVYADLTRFTGSARCYIALEPPDLEDYGLVGDNPPVPVDAKFYYFESAAPRTQWGSSVLGGFMPPFPDCSDTPYPFRGWLLHSQVIIVAPDFQYNIADCQPCTTCNADLCAPGTGSASLDRDSEALDVNVGLGMHSFGQSAGQLSLHAIRPDPSLSTPSALEYHASPESGVLRGTNGVLRQVLNSQALVDIVPLSGRQYEIRFYTVADAGTQNSSGLYEPTGSPFNTIGVANPDESGTTFNQLRVTESGGETGKVSDFTWSDEDQKWTLTTGNGLRQESVSSTWDEYQINRTDVYTIMDGTGQNVLYKEQQTFHVFPWGEEVVEKVVDPNGAALTTTWSYYDDGENDGDNYSHLKQVVEPSGSWERYQYDSLGRTIEVDAQFEDSPPDDCNGQCHVTTTTYGTGDPAVTTVETIHGQEISRRYTVYRPGEVRDIQAVTPTADWDNPTNLVATTRTYLGGLFEGRVKSIIRPDGTMSIYQYQYVPSGGGSNLITTVSTGQPNGGGTAIANGTKTVTTANQAGVTIREETHDITDENDTLLAWSEAVSIDDFGRATQINYSDGTSVTNVYGCCGISSTTDREGNTTAYAYDALKRLATTTRAGITTSNNYDAAGNVLSTVRIGTDNSTITLNSSTYDVAGRLTSSTDGVTNTTSYSEIIDSNGHRTKTTTYPDSTTRVETYYQDGQLLSVTGTAVHGARYVYGTDSNGSYTQEIKLNTNGSDTSEWTKTYMDLAGRAYKVVYADGSSSQSYYDNQGQFVKQVDPDGVTTLFSYNAKGELVTTAIDMNQDGSIEDSGPDRITSNATAVVQTSAGIFRRTSTYVWSESGPVPASVADARNDGLYSSTVSYGLTNVVQTVYNGNGSRTVTATNPDGSYTVTQYQNGQISSATQYGSDNAQIASTTYNYDPHGRLNTQTNARSGATTFNYDNADRTTSVSAGGQTTSYSYDGLGRQTRVTLPDNGMVNFAYYATGELATNSGARAYPVAYTYDYAGRMKTMSTWRNYPTGGSATTTWNYDASRGFLVSKTYADNSSVTYSNSAAGRLLKRTWVRGTTTSYAYNNAGDLGTITYSDDTPSVVSTYDRRGRKTSVTFGMNTSSYTYNDAGQMLTESFPNGGVVITNSYDSFLRRSTLGAANLSLNYEYDNASRLSLLSDGTHSVTYTYLPNSALVSNVVFKTSSVTKMTTTKSYDNLNRLTSISSSAGVSPVSSFAYQYNAANQRTQAVLADGSYWIYQYDTLGQVTSGQKYWSDDTAVSGQQFGYSFDNIGNRQSATANENAGTYTANSLNQYTQRTVPGYIWEIGSAASNATVTVNLQPVNRHGEYFAKELSVNSAASAVCTQLMAVAVLKNSGGDTNQPDIVSSRTGSAFVAQSPEQFTYDEDGNLTNDGRWTYSWDGENRLISMETDTNKVGAASVARQKLLFGYDCQSRRISKVVSNWTSGTWFLASDLRFVYDGWNLVAEVGTSGSLVRSYTWGLDLSGTEQNAGGIGGLFAVTSYQSPITTHYVAYDGNGNVVALLNADSGLLSAQYEYGPFGETIRTTGAAASLNPCRFSTKYTDVETGLAYYGYRYYNSGTGRWTSRDFLEEVGGEHLYGYVHNDALNYVDPEGLNLYAIDGTGNDENAQSNVRKFVNRYDPANGPSRYYRGVGDPTDNGWIGEFMGGAFGAGAAGIVKAVVGQVCEDYHKDQDIKIDIVGFSRGAAIANEIAAELQKKGCACAVQGLSPQTSTDYPRVRFLGLFDAVYSFPRYVSWAWNDQVIPPNVQNAAHALARDETRALFRPSMLQPAWSNTQFAEQWFPGRHSDIGGTADMNQVIGTWTLRWMIDQAKAAGVQMDENGLPSLQQIEEYIRSRPKVTQPGPKTQNPTAWVND